MCTNVKPNAVGYTLQSLWKVKDVWVFKTDRQLDWYDLGSISIVNRKKSSELYQKKFLAQDVPNLWGTGFIDWSGIEEVKASEINVCNIPASRFWTPLITQLSASVSIKCGVKVLWVDDLGTTFRGAYHALTYVVLDAMIHTLKSKKTLTLTCETPSKLVFWFFFFLPMPSTMHHRNFFLCGIFN